MDSLRKLSLPPASAGNEGDSAVAAVASSAHYLYLSRILVGISNALLTTTVYTVEVASKDMRGTYSLLEAVLR